MNADDLFEMAENPNNIEGIFNYCDRWCERCPFTSRCLNFAMGQAQDPDGKMHDLDNAKFWKGMEDIFKLTVEVIQRVAEEEGIDLTQTMTPEEEADYEAREEAHRLWADNHPCTVAAKIYADMADAWLGDSIEAFQAKEAELNDLVRLNVAPEKAEEQAATIVDAVEVIRWYQLFIQVKLMRALQGQLDEADDPEFWEEFPKDSNGSAKIALVAADRSISAWGVLLRRFPDDETTFLEILAQLDRTRRLVEKQFPDARAFERPGFDTHPLP